MNEIAEFRVPELHAQRYLDSNVGRRLGSVRAVRASPGDALYRELGRVHGLFLARGEHFYSGWFIERTYTRDELESAQALLVLWTSTMEPAGECCGTVYNGSTACEICGAGRTQVSPLSLDLRKAPKRKDMARTIADEWIVSQRFAQILCDGGFTGVELRPVRHRARYQDDAIALDRYPSGRELLTRATAAGTPHPSWQFWVWLNRPEQAELSARLTAEHIEASERRARRPSAPKPPAWYQWVVTSTPVEISASTRFGISPFEEDREGRFRCPVGHVAGLARLSELSIEASSWDRSDIVVARQLVGIRRGLLVPRPLLLISPRLWRLMEREQVKGYSVEAVHLV